MNRILNLDLTEEQLSQIIFLIDEWYLSWKSNITDDGYPHRLGIAKEILKNYIYECSGIEKNN